MGKVFAVKARRFEFGYIQPMDVCSSTCLKSQYSYSEMRGRDRAFAEMNGPESGTCSGEQPRNSLKQGKGEDWHPALSSDLHKHTVSYPSLPLALILKIVSFD